MNSLALTLAQRELQSFLSTKTGYILTAATLLVDGLLFNAWAVGGSPRTSAEVLEVFFYCRSGTTILLCLFIGMRLFAEEYQLGTWTILATSPLSERQLVLGKFLGAFAFLFLNTLLTVHLPLLVMWHGKVSFGHLLAGYLGLLCLGALCLAISLLCSALSPNTLVAAIAGATSLTVLLLMWLLSRIADPPLADVLAYLALHDKHFYPFMRGIISLADVFFYVSVSGFVLYLTSAALAARRWR